MIDCPSGEIRDQLPDLVHEQLPPAARAAVVAHVATCAACAAELALLRELRRAMQAGPSVDVVRIVTALPPPPRVKGELAARRSGWRQLDWRVAAAIVVLAVGGGAAAILSGGPRRIGTPTPVAGATSTARPNVQQIATTALSIDADLGEASAVELEALLEDLESFDGLPPGEPESSVPTSGDAEEGL